MLGLRLFIKSCFPVGCVECDCRRVLFAPHISLTLCFISGEAPQDCVVLTWLHFALWGNGPIYCGAIAMNFQAVLSFIYLYFTEPHELYLAFSRALSWHIIPARF